MTMRLNTDGSKEYEITPKDADNLYKLAKAIEHNEQKKREAFFRAIADNYINWNACPSLPEEDGEYLVTVVDVGEENSPYVAIDYYSTHYFENGVEKVADENARWNTFSDTSYVIAWAMLPSPFKS